MIKYLVIGLFALSACTPASDAALSGAATAVSKAREKGADRLDSVARVAFGELCDMDPTRTIRLVGESGRQMYQAAILACPNTWGIIHSWSVDMVVSSMGPQFERLGVKVTTLGSIETDAAD